MSAIDAFLHRITDEAVLKWPRPHNAESLFPGSRPYVTCGATQSGVAGESSRARRRVQWHGGLDPASSVAIDLNSDTDLKKLYDV